MVPTRLLVNLSGLTFVDVDPQGRTVLAGRIEAKFGAENAHPLDVCERLHLALVRKRANSAE